MIIQIVIIKLIMQINRIDEHIASKQHKLIASIVRARNSSKI
jgi:hypothetical protein